MQLGVDNASGELMPGAYANVRSNCRANMQALSIPSSALIFDQNGLRVATVDADNKVVLKAITIARDLGHTIEIATGLARRPRHRQPAGRHRRRRSGARGHAGQASR